MPTSRNATRRVHCGTKVNYYPTKSTKPSYNDPQKRDLRFIKAMLFFALKVNSGNPPPSHEILETPLRRDMEQSFQTQRNPRPPCIEARKYINASSGPRTNHPQRSQRYHASYYNPYLVEPGSIAAYEISHHAQVNLVKSGFLVAYEASHACPTDKEIYFEEATPNASLHSPPGSDQHISSPIVANVDTRPPPLGQRSDFPMSESQRYKMADAALHQQEQDATPDGAAPVLKQQPSLPQKQVPTETIPQVSPTSQRMPTYSNVNIVTPLHQYNNHNDNITTTTVSSTKTTVTTSPTNRVLPMQQRQCAQRYGNENKISYETEVKQISSHSPIPNGMKRNINNLSNQLQQQSALHNRPLLHANVTKHALPSLVAAYPNNHHHTVPTIMLNSHNDGINRTTTNSTKSTITAGANYAHANRNERNTISMALCYHKIIAPCSAQSTGSAPLQSNSTLLCSGNRLCAITI
uniref:Uncharacterized protein n=1 Tax=Glossina austeni TaxID=7395 RepID=A0A1A9VH09_GLOAU